MDAFGSPIVKAEPRDDNAYSSFVVQDDEEDQGQLRGIKRETMDDDDSLFIPEAPAPCPANYTPITMADLAYRPAPSSRPTITHQELPSTQTSTLPPTSSFPSSFPSLPDDLQAFEKKNHSRIPDSDGNEAPTLCFEGGIRRNGFQHRLVCGHVVVTDIRLPCGTKCGLPIRSDKKPASKSTIECPHPSCVSVRKSMRIVLRSRPKPRSSTVIKPGVRVVSESQKGHSINFGGLDIQNIKSVEGSEQAQRPNKRIRTSSAFHPTPAISAADEAAERLLKERLNPNLKQERELRRLQVDGTDTLKFKQPAGWQMDQDTEIEKLRRRRQLTQNLSGNMYSMPEDHHDQLIKGAPGLVVDRELEDTICNNLARAKGVEVKAIDNDEYDLSDPTKSFFTSDETDVHCVCSQPIEHTMLQCVTCKHFFHANCLGKGLLNPSRHEMDPDMSNLADAEHWRASDEEFSCRTCDANTRLAQNMLGSRKYKKPEEDLDSKHYRHDLREGKLLKLRECKTAAEKERVQQVWKLLYSHEDKLNFNDFMCAKCDQHITGTRYHCTACILFDLCESCMRNSKDHYCSANSSSFQVYYPQSKDVEMSGTDSSTAANNQSMKGRPMRRAAVKAMGGMADLTHPGTIAETRRRTIFQ